MLIALLILIPMMRGSNKEMLINYQQSLEDMNSEAVEYVRGIPVTKTFQQSIFFL
ncbi:hypothetical protein [Methanobrevibacter arboriphilus]|uniref:hypothetical protein n=1 Tax=Methanobrevibacter arboriphilus TaxID=39441 RepID=UPI000A5CD4A6|nr:hypothetical protein [Methanobrevibacter arboriphilus]